MVTDVLASRNQLFVIMRGREEPAAVGVGEPVDHGLGNGDGPIENLRVKGRFVKGEQSLKQEGVIFKVGVEPGFPTPPGAQQCALAITHLVPDEVGGAPRGLEVFRPVEEGSGFGEGRDHQSVPGAEHLVVKRRTDPCRPRTEQVPSRRLQDGPEFGWRNTPGDVKNVSALKVALGRGSEGRHGFCCAVPQNLFHFGPGPCVEETLDALRVSVERCVEAA